MDQLRKDIATAASTRHYQLQRVLYRIPSIISGKKATLSVSPYGSFVDGTLTAHSDLDVSLSTFGDWSNRADNLIKLLKERGYTIKGRSFGSCLVPFEVDGVGVDLVIETYHKHDETSNRVLSLGRANSNYVDIVRFLKTFAYIYVDRRPKRQISAYNDLQLGDKPSIPGSCLYTYSTALALNLISNYATEETASFDFISGLKRVCEFLGEGKYEVNGRPHPAFESWFHSNVKFTCGKENKEKFNKLFRALLAHLEAGKIPEEMHPTRLPMNQELAVEKLLQLTADAEKERAQLILEKEEKKEQEKKEKEKKEKEEKDRKLEQMKKERESCFYDDYESDDYDDGFYAANGKRYNDYTDYYESDSFDEDWHD